MVGFFRVKASGTPVASPLRLLRARMRLGYLDHQEYVGFGGFRV